MTDLYRILLIIVLSSVVLLSACGGEGKGTRAQGQGGESASPTTDEPRVVDPGGTLVESGPVDSFDSEIADVVNRMFETRTPTGELLAELPGGFSHMAKAVIRKLRSQIAFRQEDDWSLSYRASELRERRACLAAALGRHQGIVVDVYHLRLPEALVEAYAGEGEFAPLLVTKTECLRVSREQSHLLGSYGPVILREGETARLTTGWTRARLAIVDGSGRIERDRCMDRFSGLRVAVSAHSIEGKAGKWELGVFASSAALVDETAIEARPFGQHAQSSSASRSTEGKRLRLESDERCWLVRMGGDFVGVVPDTQVLVCARVVKID